MADAAAADEEEGGHIELFGVRLFKHTLALGRTDRGSEREWAARSPHMVGAVSAAAVAAANCRVG